MVFLFSFHHYLVKNCFSFISLWMLSQNFFFTPCQTNKRNLSDKWNVCKYFKTFLTGPRRGGWVCHRRNKRDQGRPGHRGHQAWREILQKGSRCTSQSSEIRKIRGHVEPHVFERCIRSAQSKAEILCTTHLCKSWIIINDINLLNISFKCCLYLHFA